MNENEKLREISRLVFSFALPGVTFKVGAQATKAAGGIVRKAAVAVEKAPSKYGLRSSTLAQRPKAVPSEVISEPLIKKYSEFMVKPPEATRTLRTSTLIQGKPGGASTAKSLTLGYNTQSKVKFSPAIESFAVKTAFDGALYPKDKLSLLISYLERRDVYVYGTNGNPCF